MIMGRHFERNFCFLEMLCEVCRYVLQSGYQTAGREELSQASSDPMTASSRLIDRIPPVVRACRREGCQMRSCIQLDSSMPPMVLDLILGQCIVVLVQMQRRNVGKGEHAVHGHGTCGREARGGSTADEDSADSPEISTHPMLSDVHNRLK